MTFLNVGNKKLKVILTAEEGDRYSVRSIEAGEPTPSLRAALREILTLAEEDCGFDPSGDRLLVQLFPLDSGGAELFVTKLSSVPERERRTLSESGIMTYADKSAFFRFPDAKSLAGAARARAHRVARVYRSNSGEYYLAIAESVLSGISDCEILSEFGDRIHKLPLGLNGEYGSLILADKPLSSLIDL